MKEIFIYLTETLTVEQILEDIQKAVTTCQTEPTEDNLKKLQMHCVMFATKRSMKNKSVSETLKELDKLEQAVKLTERLDPTN